MAPAVGRLASLAAVGVAARPAHPGDLQPRRPGGPHGARRLRPDRRPGRQPGALGPVHGDHARARRHRRPRAAAGRHADRASPSARCKGVETFALKTPDQLDDARAFCEEHGSAQMDASPTWRMLVSPPRARSTAADRRRATCSPGSRSATWRPARRDRVAPARRHGRRVAGRGRRPGLPRQPLIRLHPEAVPDGHHPPPAPVRRILGVGGYRPTRVIPNEEILEHDRLQRRVDPAALRHQAAPLGRRPTRPCR